MGQFVREDGAGTKASQPQMPISRKKNLPPSVGDSSHLSAYLKQISHYPLLSLEEERMIGKQMKDTRGKLESLERSFAKSRIPEDQYRKDREVLEHKLELLKNRMVTANLRLVELLKEALEKKPFRKKTKVPKRIKFQRLEEKKRRSILKRERSLKDDG